MAKNDRIGANLRVRYGICIADDCEMAKNKTRQEVRSGYDFVCSECGRELRETFTKTKTPDTEEGKRKKKRKKKILIAVISAVAVCGVGGLIFALTGSDSDSDSLEVVAQPEVVDIEVVEPEPKIEEVESVEDVTAESKTTPQTTTVNSVVTKDLGYAVYKGKMKNGKMNDDNGVLTFKSRHVIESRDVKQRTAEPGEKVIGIFEDGHLITGIWYKNDGNQETIIP